MRALVMPSHEIQLNPVPAKHFPEIVPIYRGEYPLKGMVIDKPGPVITIQVDPDACPGQFPDHRGPVCIRVAEKTDSRNLRLPQGCLERFFRQLETEG